MQRDLDAFRADWGAKAEQLGWSAAELYGLAPVASRCRFDAMGLVPLLEGKRVVAMDETRATLECKALRGYTPAKQTFIRHRARRAAEASTVAMEATARDLRDELGCGDLDEMIKQKRQPKLRLPIR